jgi:hypothetical protein
MNTSAQLPVALGGTFDTPFSFAGYYIDAETVRHLWGSGNTP